MPNPNLIIHINAEGHLTSIDIPFNDKKSREIVEELISDQHYGLHKSDLKLYREPINDTPYLKIVDPEAMYKLMQSIRKNQPNLIRYNQEFNSAENQLLKDHIRLEHLSYNNFQREVQKEAIDLVNNCVYAHPALQRLFGNPYPFINYDSNAGCIPLHRFLRDLKDGAVEVNADGSALMQLKSELIKNPALAETKSVSDLLVKFQNLEDSMDERLTATLDKPIHRSYGLF